MEQQTEQPKPEFTVNLDELKPQEHRWVDRGLVVSCEGAGHPPHRAFKRSLTIEGQQAEKPKQ